MGQRQIIIAIPNHKQYQTTSNTKIESPIEKVLLQRDARTAYIQKRENIEHTKHSLTYRPYQKSGYNF